MPPWPSQFQHRQSPCRSIAANGNVHLARLRTIEAEDAAFTPGWWEAWQRCKAECDKVPHVTFPPEAYTGGRCQTTADTLELSRARKDVAALDAGKMHLDPLPGLREHYDIKRELVKAADAREQQIQAIRDRYDMDAADERGRNLATCWPTQGPP